MNTYEYRILYTPTTNTVIVESSTGECIVNHADNWTDVLQTITECYGSDLDEEHAHAVN